MAGTWTKLTVSANVRDLDDVVAVMSMLDNGLMIEDFSDFSLNGMYGELVDESILNADKETVKVSLFVPEERSLAEYRDFITSRLGALGIKLDQAVDLAAVILLSGGKALFGVRGVFFDLFNIQHVSFLTF